MPPGRLPGHWYRVDLILWGEIHQRCWGWVTQDSVLWLPAKRDYGPDLNQKQVPVCTMRWRTQGPTYSPRSLDYNSLLLHLKIPIHTPRSSFCVWPPAYNMIQLQCLMNERTEQNHLKNCIMLLYWC